MTFLSRKKDTLSIARKSCLAENDATRNRRNNLLGYTPRVRTQAGVYMRAKNSPRTRHQVQHLRALYVKRRRHKDRSATGAPRQRAPQRGLGGGFRAERRALTWRDRVVGVLPLLAEASAARVPKHGKKNQGQSKLRGTIQVYRNSHRAVERCDAQTTTLATSLEWN